MLRLNGNQFKIYFDYVNQTDDSIHTSGKQLVQLFINSFNMSEATPEEKYMIQNIYTELGETFGKEFDPRYEKFEECICNRENQYYQLLSLKISSFLLKPIKDILDIRQERNKKSSIEHNSKRQNNLDDSFDVQFKEGSDVIEHLHNSDLVDFMTYLCYYSFMDSRIMKQYLSMVTIAELSSTNDLLKARVGLDNISLSDNNPLIDKDFVPEKSFDIFHICIPKEDFIGEVCDAMINDKELTKEDALNLVNILDLSNESLEELDDMTGYSKHYIESYFKLYHHALTIIIKADDKKLAEKVLNKVLDTTLSVYHEFNLHRLPELMIKVILNIGKVLFGIKPQGRYPKRFNENKDNPEYVSTIQICEYTQNLFRKISLPYNKFENNDGIIESSMYQSSLESNSESTVSVMELKESSYHLMRALTETFEVLRDGTIKVTLPEKSTFMNEYAVNHRLLKYNMDNQNYDGVKYNLIYHMILIENIEKNVLYNEKVDKLSSLYKDAEKARNFAKNDISVYLPQLKRVDRTFDINKFYKKVKADKATITINGVETASGIKKIFKSILYS